MHERELLFFSLWWGDERQLQHDKPNLEPRMDYWKASEVQILQGFGSALGSLPVNCPNKGIMESFSGVRAQKHERKFSEMVGLDQD